MFADIYGVAFAVCVLMVVIGGFRMIFSFGNREKMAKGGKTVWHAVLGFIIILCSWIIINTVMHIIGARNADSWWKMDG